MNQEMVSETAPASATIVISASNDGPRDTARQPPANQIAAPKCESTPHQTCPHLILPVLICGHLREIPFGRRLIDSSFGFLGAIPFLDCLKLTRTLEQHESSYA